MIVVDSGAWVAYFNGSSSSCTSRLELALEQEDDLAILPVILTEVLQGFRTERGFRRARELLLAVPVLFPSLQTHVRAATLFRSLRARGVTVRGAVDCIIAQSCIDAGADLLTLDGDFLRIADHAPLSVLKVG